MWWSSSCRYFSSSRRILDLDSRSSRKGQPNLLPQQSSQILALAALVAMLNQPAVLTAQSARLPDPLQSGETNTKDQIDRLMDLGTPTDNTVTYRNPGLTVMTPAIYQRQARRFLEIASITRHEYERLFGDLSKIHTSIILMEAAEFYKATNTPSWTNAIFFRRKIVVPIEKGQPLDEANIVRSIRHEYLHAVVYDLGRGEVPGWLDEGLAQWIEGSENPNLRNTLRNWIKKNSPLPLSILQGGFTKLEAGMVPAAYGQSLFATKLLIQQGGIGIIKQLLANTKRGLSFEHAFRETTGVSLGEFEVMVGSSLTSWADEHKEHKAVKLVNADRRSGE